MEVTYSWLIYSCLFFGSSILCDRKLEKRQALSSCSDNTDDKFYCSTERCIKSSWVCDGRQDCADGSDETKELCSLYGYGTNITPGCGRVNIKNRVILEKSPAIVGTAPWNVGIYKLGVDNSKYELICGGSIFSPNLVISAAHCFWQKGMISYTIPVNDGLYKIAVGKYARDIKVIDNDFTKIINVRIIHMKKGFHGFSGFHTNNIAIIVLQDRVSFSDGVAPVCIDWNDKYKIANGDLGKVVGWGKPEKSIISPVLLETCLPYIDHNSCRDLYTSGFESYVSADKFCAGSQLLRNKNLDSK